MTSLDLWSWFAVVKTYKQFTIGWSSTDQMLSKIIWFCFISSKCVKIKFMVNFAPLFLEIWKQNVTDEFWSLKIKVELYPWFLSVVSYRIPKLNRLFMDFLLDHNLFYFLKKIDWNNCLLYLFFYSSYFDSHTETLE